MPEKEDVLYDLMTEMRQEQRDFRKELREDMGEFREEVRQEVRHSCSQLGKVEQRLSGLELQLAIMGGEQKTVAAMFNAHTADANLHFNPYHDESGWEKIKRKKFEIGTGVSISSIMATIIYILIDVLA